MESIEVENTMFQNLVIEAEETIYKKAKLNKIVRKIEITYGVVLEILGFLLFIDYYLKWGVTGLLLVTLFVITPVCMKWEELEKRRYRRELLKEYKTNILDRWKQLLKDSRWKLYNINGLQWIIASCDRELAKKGPIEIAADYLKKVCEILIIPIVTVAFTQIIKDAEINDIIGIVILYLVMAVILAGLGLIVGAFLKMPTGLKKMQYENIHDDVEYILIELREESIY